MPFLGRRGLPAPVAAVALEPGERRLSWALVAGGGAVVATELGLHMPGEPRVDWADIERVSWKRPVLVVLRVALVGGSGMRWTAELDEARNLPEVVRSRVVESIGWSEHHRLPPAGGVRIVGRRRPGRELLDWQLVYDRDTGPPDEQQRAQAEALLLAARRTIG